MTCPKCDEGKIVKVKIKKTGKVAFMCDFCERIWLEGEDIGRDPGHVMGTNRNGEREYTLDDLEEKDQEHKSARLPTDK
ncbi:MAG: hypothetical protein A2687_05235 [Candidatus Levybacteria bacterium RIFCSPHIGHO2_01_FULL_38_26]|nr:MAG: hypothetical protein A2687_05235 [Candidatus Levybacteria bacterium RIFCSPHIGHO2_01_FULL_38_26]